MKGSRERVAAGLGLAGLIIGTAALGGAPRWASIATTTLLVGSAACYFTARRSTRSEIFYFFLITCALTAIQWIPLPIALVGLASPDKLELVKDNARAMATPVPSTMRLSYDGPATLLALVRLVGYAAFAFVCVRLAAQRRWRKRLVTTIVLTAAALSVTAIVHQLAGLSLIYGFVTPPGGLSELVLGPIVNPNHLASLLALGVPVAAGLAIAARSQRRAWWVGIALLLVAGTLITRSRGGALGLGVGLFVGGMIWLRQSRKAGRGKRGKMSIGTIVPAAIVGFCAVVLVVISTGSGLVEDLGKSRTDELSGQEGRSVVWQRAATLVGNHAIAGVGRGAFQFAYSRIQQTSQTTYSHVENEYLQSVVDWGIPGAAFLAALLVLMIRRAWGKWDAGPVEAGVLGGLAGLAVHSLFDFSLELPAVGLSAIGLAALVLPGQIQRSKRGPTTVRIRRGLAFAGAGLCIILAATAQGRQAATEGRELAAQISVGSHADPAATTAAWRRHPSDYLMAGLVAQQLLRQGDERSVAVLNRALFLNPKHPTLHALAVRALFAAGKKSQALVEMALALQYAEHRRPLVDDLTRTFTNPTDIAAGVPITDLNAALNVIAILQRADHKEAAWVAAERTRDAHPDAPEIQTVLVRLALVRADHPAALTAAKRAVALRPDATSVLLLARALSVNGDYANGIKTLTTALANRTIEGRRQETRAHNMLARMRIDSGDLVGARADLLKVISLSATPAARARAHRELAEIENKQGNLQQAELERKMAEKLEKVGQQGR